jgi:DNA invertase Pin-like site-specific DNA recombinase
VAYLRVSTEGQGRSGLGLEAQRQAVATYLAQHGGELLAEFQEVESGKRASRPQLAAALACCRTRRAALLVAKLDRLARDARFLLNLVEGAGEAGVVFCDLPQVPPGPMGRFLLTQMAAVAELEAGLIGQRTRVALAAAKARGTRLGNPRLRPGTPAAAGAARAARAELVQVRAAELRAVLDELRAEGAMPEGASLRQVAAALQARGVRASQGGARWSAAQVRRVLGKAAS